jgi:hypothetical protein
VSDSGYYKGPVGPDGKYIASLVLVVPVFLWLVIEVEILVIKILWWLDILGG